ncbi:hypothetical protein [Streptomyces sp. bgisy091]|uniref:hypothetical protein n=1 Tax=Streptomyces sp. bgisy091 TaxID=3413778 RepID=UPI003D7607AB
MSKVGEIFMLKSRIAAVLGAGAAAVMLMATNAVATDGVQTATVVDQPSAREWVCEAVATYGGGGCFAAYGDWFGVTDSKSDGHSTVLVWTVYNKDGSFDRGGSVWNTAGASTSRFLNKDFPEGRAMRFKICLGESSDHDVIDSTCGPYATTTTS